VSVHAARPEPRVSIVVPVLDEEAVLPLLLPRLRAAMDALPAGAEAWFVDDGSRDATARLVAEAHATTTGSSSCSCRATSARPRP
jgi:glycosyltransferase involved in cell wall biosynthesis